MDKQHYWDEILRVWISWGGGVTVKIVNKLPQMLDTHQRTFSALFVPRDTRLGRSTF